MRTPAPHVSCWRGRFTWVYVMYDADGRCLYVGMTYLLRTRWKQHQRTNPHITSQVARCQLIGPFTRDKARQVEVARQLELRPVYNRDKVTRSA